MAPASRLCVAGWDQARRHAGERSSPGPGDCGTGTRPDEMGSRRRVEESARGIRHRYQGRSLTVAPATPRLIDRGDLLAALDGAAAKKVTIISAPAGRGKTPLLRVGAVRAAQPPGLPGLRG